MDLIEDFFLIDLTILRLFLNFMKYLYILFVFTYTSILCSQNDLKSMMKKYADKDWCFIKKENNEFVFYNYCKPLWFRFTDKEFITNDGAYGTIEKYGVEKILYNNKEQSLEIYSGINGVTLKLTITKVDNNTLNISYLYFVDVEDKSSIRYSHEAMAKSEFNKLKIVKACNLNKRIKVAKEDTFEEPPAPPK